MAGGFVSGAAPDFRAVPASTGSPEAPVSLSVHLVCNIILKESPRREMRGRSGRRDGDRAKQKSSGIPALRESNRGWAYERPRGYPASQETTETPARRRRRSDPRARTAATAAPPSGDVRSVNAAEAEQGCQVRHQIGRWRKLPAGGGNFRVDCGGEGARGREWADAGLAARRSAPGRSGTSLECGGARL